jgi:hypothetical protein
MYYDGTFLYTFSEEKGHARRVLDDDEKEKLKKFIKVRNHTPLEDKGFEVDSPDYDVDYNYWEDADRTVQRRFDRL